MRGLSFKEMCEYKWPAGVGASSFEPVIGEILKEFVEVVTEELQDIQNDLSIAEDSDDVAVLEGRVYDVYSKLTELLENRNAQEK